MKLILFGLLVLIAIECRAQDSDQVGENFDENMTIDQMIVSAMTKNSMNYLTDLDGRTVMTEMDMVFTSEQWKAMQEADSDDSDDKSRQKRKAVREEGYRWTNRIIPYRIARGVFDSRAQGEIRKAIQEWERYTCIRFTQRSSQRNYVYFDNGSGCYSYVGMTGGAQTIGLAGGCRYKGVIVHEIGHAVGFHHEQNRPDRDSYVRILRQNIPSNLYYNFKKYPYSAVNLYDVPYDYGSIMHYGGTAFSTNGQLTIQTINRADQHKIGNRKGLSFRDIKLANRMYECNSKCSSSIKCPGEGFVGSDCKCYCPGNPIRLCSGTTGTGKTTRRPVTRRPTTRRPVVTTKAPCRNMNRRCGQWAAQGFCSRSNYMQMYCKPACDLCRGGPVQVCQDDNEHCAYWQRQGFCSEYKSYMKNNCKKSCGYCGRRTVSSTDDSDSEAEASQGGDNGDGNTETGVSTERKTDGNGAAGITAGKTGENGSAGRTAGFWVYLSSLVVMAVALFPAGL